MGRTVLTPKKQAIPPGFLQELNCDLMEDLWYALAAAKHPEAFDGSQPHPGLHEVFEKYLADVTWEDFWHAFPYELREQGDCLDEIDALGILLSTSISRSRFQRHFEQLACSSTTSSSSSNNSSSSTQQVNLPVRISNVHRSSSSRALARAFSGAPAPRSGGYAAAMAATDQEEAEEWRRESEFMDMLLRRMSSGETQPNRGGLLESPERARQPPARRFSRRNLAPMPLPQLLPAQAAGQQQQVAAAAARQQHVAYVSPAAPGRTTATTRTGRLGLYAHLAQRANQQQQQQPRSVTGTEQYADLFELLQQQLGTPPPDSPQWINPYGDPMLQDLPLAPSLDQFEPSEPGLERRETTLMASIQAAIAARSAAAARAADSSDYRDYAAAAAAAARALGEAVAEDAAAAAAGAMQPPRSNAEALGARRPTEPAAAAGAATAGASGAAEGAAARPHRGWWRQIVAEEGHADGPQIAFDHRGPPLFREQRAPPPAAAAASAGTASPPAPAAAAAAAGHGQRPRRVGMLLNYDNLAASMGFEAPSEQRVPLLFGSDGAAAASAGAAQYGWQEPQQQQHSAARGSGEGVNQQEPPAAAAEGAEEQEEDDVEFLPVFRGRRGRSQRHAAAARTEGASSLQQASAEPPVPTAAAAAAAATSLAAAAAASPGPGAAAAGTAAPVAPAAAAAAPSGGGQRLTGQRRTWQEACDPEGFEQERQQQQQRQQRTDALAAAAGQGADTAVAATVPPPAAAAAADTNAAAEAGAAAATSAADNGSGSGSGRAVDYSKVWRAVHEWMTGEDEDLLGLVSQVVPYSMAGRGLKAQDDTLQQLRVLARSRAVPQKVITAVADRLYQPCPSGEAHLVRLTASSGFSKQAAAAAAVLDCVERHGMLPFYIPLAGLCTEDAVEAAVMRGLFGSAHAHSSLQQQQAQVSGAPASPVAAGALAAVGTAAAAAAAAGGLQQSADLTLEDMGAMVALMESNQAVFRPSPAAVSPPQQLRGLGFGLGFPPSVRPASSTPSSRGSEDVDQLAAHLTLLGRCHSRQPMVVLLDEVDAAMTPDDGRPLREVLMQLLYRLPQAVVVMTSSSGLDAWRDAAVLRQVGEPMVQDLYDGRLVLVEHKLPKSHLHPRCYDYIL